MQVGLRGRASARRLELLNGDAATVDTVIDPDLDGGWVRVVIRMPVAAAPPTDAEPKRAAEPV